MSDLSDYKRCVSDPLEADLRAQVSRLTAERDALKGDYLSACAQLDSVTGNLETATADLTAARALLGEAEKVLEPFARDGRGIHPDWADNRRRTSLSQSNPPTVGDFRAAADLHSRLSGKGGEG